MRKPLTIGLMGAVVLVAAGILLNDTFMEDAKAPLKVGVAPYQDMAMLYAAEPNQIDEKNDVELELISMQWADLTPAVASATRTVDVAFASLIQFIAQEPTLNSNTDDPIVFFYPAYVFKGGAFMAFDDGVPEITRETLSDAETIRSFLSHSFAVQRTSSYEILLHDLAGRIGMSLDDVERVDVDSSDGLLAAINGSVDVFAAGLTQKNDALKKGGRSVLEMDALGQVDVAGFIAKRSTLEARAEDIDKLMRVWVDSIDFVMSDIEQNSKDSLAFLRAQSSTDYSIDEYKTALSQEWLPTSIAATRSEIIEPGARYDYRRVVESVSSYYLANDLIPRLPENIELISIDP